jgi:hypothetical protein
MTRDPPGRSTPAPPRAAFGALVGVLMLACNPTRGQPGPGPSSGSNTRDGGPVDEPILHVPVGRTILGSRPGEPGREPRLEPVAYHQDLGPFRVDRTVRLDESGKPQSVSSPASANALCAQTSGRLCTEIEWERACRADLGFEARGAPEWTMSTLGKTSVSPDAPALRGQKDSRTDSSQCARRQAATPSTMAAFRCCYGAPNAPRLKEPTESSGAPFRVHPMSRDELRHLLETDPKTAPLANSAEFFPDDAVATVIERGPGDLKGFELTTQPVQWDPDIGVSFLVIAGRAEPKTVFVVVYYDKTEPPILAGSFVMMNEKGPVAIAYASSIRPRIHFSTCWGCPGETGKALFREPESVVLLQP